MVNIDTKSELANDASAPAKKGPSILQIAVIAALALGFAALLAYQFVFCAGCYG